MDIIPHSCPSCHVMHTYSNPMCKPCHSAYQKHYHATHKHEEQFINSRQKAQAAYKERLRKKPKQKPYVRYTLSKRKKEHMLQEQEHRCAICHDERELIVEHCHKTGIVRGLVCRPCNTRIGVVENSTNGYNWRERHSIYIAIYEYLDRYKK